MNIPVFIIALFILQIVCFFVAKKASKQLATQEDYFLAGKGVKLFPLLMTLIATQIGGGLVLGAAEEAYRYGWYVLFYPLGACLGLLVLAAGIGKKLSEYKVSTVAQLFEVVYGSVVLKKLASALSIISLFMILIGQVIASKKFMVSLGVDSTLIYVGFWSIVILYTVTGGLKAVVATDIVQAVFFIVVFGICFGYSFFANNAPDIVQGVSLESFEFSQAKIWGWLFMPLLFMMIEQDMAQRCFAAKNGRIVSWASGLAAVTIMLVCAIPIYFGLMARELNIEAVKGSSVLMNVLPIITTPTLAALFGCAILAAIISTADSLMNAISSNVSQDFGWKQNNVRSSQWVTLGIGVAAFLSSSYFDNVVDILIQSYELSVSCLFVPIFAAFFKRNGNTISAILAIIFGAFGFIVVRIFGIDFMPREAVSLILSVSGFLLGELQAKITQQTSVVAYVIPEGTDPNRK